MSMGGMGKRRLKIKIERSEEKFFKSVQRCGDKFPNCHGKYPDCSQEALALQQRDFQEEEIPRSCKLCPFYKW
jgi:hypothetical protein